MMEPSASGGSASGSGPAVGAAGAGGEPPAKKTKTGEPVGGWRLDKRGKRDKTAWEENEDITQFAIDLKDIKPLKAGDTCLKPDGQPLSSDEFKLVEEVGMEIYPLKASLHETETSEDNTWLFVRKHAKEVWNEVLNRNFNNSAVIGSPGIGKSVSSLYLLKQLLEKNELVIYEARRDKLVYAFIPPGRDGDDKEYVVYSTDYKYWSPQSCPALAVSKNYYLIDPGKAADITVVMSHTIVFPSPDPERLGDWAKHSRTFYFGPWTEEEVFSVRPFMRVDGVVMSEDTLRKSFRRFGGILRHVYSAADAQLPLKQKASRVLKDAQLVSNVYAKGIEALGTKDRDKPPSALFTLVPVEDEESADEIFKLMPGSFRPFAQAQIAIVSDWARSALVNHYWDDVHSVVVGRTHQNAAHVGWLFEDAAHLALARGGRFERRYLGEKKEKDKDALELGEREVKVVAGGFGVCLVAIKDKKNKGFYVRPMNPKTCLLDAAEGGTTDLYQMTIDLDHKLAEEPLRTAVKALLPKGKAPLVLNWVVPEHMFKVFKLRSVPDDLKGRVEQRVICCTPQKPAVDD